MREKKKNGGRRRQKKKEGRQKREEGNGLFQFVVEGGNSKPEVKVLTWMILIHIVNAPRISQPS